MRADTHPIDPLPKKRDPPPPAHPPKAIYIHRNGVGSVARFYLTLVRRCDTIPHPAVTLNLVLRAKIARAYSVIPLISHPELNSIKRSQSIVKVLSLSLQVGGLSGCDPDFILCYISAFRYEQKQYLSIRF